MTKMIHPSSALLLLATAFAAGAASAHLLKPHPGPWVQAVTSGPHGEASATTEGRSPENPEIRAGDPPPSAEATSAAFPPPGSSERWRAVRAAAAADFDATVAQLVDEGRREWYVEDFTNAVLAAPPSASAPMVGRIHRLPLAEVRARVAGAAGIEMLRTGEKDAASSLLEECVRLDVAGATTTDQWRAVDPAAAAEILARLPAGEHTRGMVAHVAEEWASSDRQAALAYAEALPRSADRVAAVRQVFARVAATDAAGARAMFAAMKSGRARSAAAQELALAIARNESLPAAIGWLDESVQGRVASDIVAALVFDRFAADPAATAAAVPDLAAGPARSAAVETIALNWRYKDPAAATAWLGKLPRDESSRSTCYALIAEEWGARSLDEAVRFASVSNPDAPSDPAFARELAAHFAGRDPEAAAAWAWTLPETFRGRILEDVMIAWALGDPGAAAAHAADLGIDDPAASAAAAGAVARTWAVHDPAEFESWATQLPDAALRTAALMSAAGAVVGDDAELALRFAWFVPDEGARDRVVGAVIAHLRRTLTASRLVEFTLTASLPDAVRNRLASEIGDLQPQPETPEPATDGASDTEDTGDTDVPPAPPEEE